MAGRVRRLVCRWGRGSTITAIVAGALAATGILGPGVTAQAAVTPATSAVPAFATGPGQLATGDDHTCAIGVDQTLWCWGRNTEGALGNGSRTSAATSTPEQVGADHWLWVVGGRQTTCGIRADHTLWCWGSNRQSEVPGATGAFQLTPLQIGVRNDWATLTEAGEVFYGITLKGKALTWGHPANGLHPAPRAVPLGPWTTVDIGGNQTVCGIAPDRHLTCIGGTATAPTSIRLAPGSWTALAAGDLASCGITAAGALSCWGSNTYGQLGTGTTDPSATPVPIAAGGRWATADIGRNHACAIDVRGRLSCWGSNVHGQLGTGSTSASLVPVRVGTGTDWANVQVGISHTCAVTTSGALYCWGENTFGQLGNADTADALTPTFVS